MQASFYLTDFFSEAKDGREGKDVSCAEELELELEALDITDDPLELEAAEEAENEELAKKLLDEQGGELQVHRNKKTNYRSW